MLTLRSQFLELLSVDFHVGPDHRVGDRCHGLIPMGILRRAEQTFHNYWIRFAHVSFHNLLKELTIKQKQTALGRLIMHALAGRNEASQQGGAVFGELGFCVFAH